MIKLFYINYNDAQIFCVFERRKQFFIIATRKKISVT